MTTSRRRFLGTAATLTVGTALAGCATSLPRTTGAAKPAFVLVHGAWHGAWAFARVIPELAARGHLAVAIDLPGHGLDARFPLSYRQRPLDRAAFAAERSPVASITLEQCADHVIATIDQLHAGGFSKVVLVGHSLSGVVLTRVGEKAPEKLSALVYLTALMLPAGQSAGDVFGLPQAAGIEVPSLIMADPGAVGASRIDPASTDADYRMRSKSAFYGDLSDAQVEAATHLLTPDEPAALGGVRTEKTLARWGRVPRHFIKCLQDRTIPPALQQLFIDQADAFTPGNVTRVHSLDSSHSPFLSMPGPLAAVMSDIAA